MKLTPKQEAFAKAYIETGNASEAYRQAGYSGGSPKTVNEAASRLLKNSKVAARIAGIQAEHQKRHEVTVDSLVAELEQARALAMKIEAPAPMVAATMGKGKLLGLVVDKAEHTGKGGKDLIPDKPITPFELARYMAFVLEQASARKPNGHANGHVNGHANGHAA